MTTRDMLRDIRSQREAMVHYAQRARDLEVIADDFEGMGMPLHARKARGHARLVRQAARREAEPERGA